jgi:hypothetical protein
MVVKAEGHGRSIEREFLTGLQKAKTTDDVRHLEAKAAQIWWAQWAGVRMSFKGAGVPTEWRSWPRDFTHRLAELFAAHIGRPRRGAKRVGITQSIGKPPVAKPPLDDRQ